MRTQLPQIVALALLVCAGAVCVYAEQDSNSRRGDYGFGTRNAPRTTTEFYTKIIKDDQSDRPDAQTIPSVSGKIIEWTDDGVCEFRTDSGDRYHVKLWLIEMPKEGQPNYHKLMKFARSHDIYGEGCKVKLRIIAENQDKPEYKIGILTVSSSSSCQEAFWKSGYCGLDDSERELERNESEAKKLCKIFSRIQKGEQEPEEEEQKTSSTEGAGETVDDGDDSGSKTKDESEDKMPPTTEQSPAPQEDKGVQVPGYGSTKPRDDALKGILIDLSHQPQKKGLSTSSRRGAEEERRLYESRENQSKMLRDSIHNLSTTWNIKPIKDKHLVSYTTRYTTSIYIPVGGYTNNNHGFDVPVAGASSRSMPCWLCYYEGHFGVPEEGDYRFVGYAEYVMLVGVDLGGAGKKTQTVLYAFKPREGFGAAVKCGKDWEPTRFCGPGIGDDGLEVEREESIDKRLYKGSWLHLVPDKRYFIKIAFGTLNDNMRARLGVQKKDRDTDDNFPLFTLEKVSFPVYHNNSFGVRSSSGSRSASTTWELREKGQYNSTCVFAPPKEQPKIVKPKTTTDSTPTTTTPSRVRK